MKIKFLVLLLLSFGIVHAQLDESFSDGDFTTGITWGGTVTAWQVVSNSDAGPGATGSSTLRLNTPSGSGLQYLSTQISGSWGTQQSWGFWLGRRAQAATASNMSLVWLYANEADVSSTTVDGYRIRLGDDISSGDKIILESVNNGVPTSVISSSPVTNGITDYGILVRVTRDGSGLWNLYTSALPTATGTGVPASAIPNNINASVLHGSATQNVISSFDNGYIAFESVHTSTAAARTGAEFDQLVFSFAGSAPLPVRFGNIQAIETSSGIRLEWENLTESDILHYKVVRSSDGKLFVPLAEITPLKNDGGHAGYQYTDHQLLNGTLYYRIEAEETDGHLRYSLVLRVHNKNARGHMDISPNPVSANDFVVDMGYLPAGNYAISIYDASGKLIERNMFQHSGGAWSRSFNHHLARGWYVLGLNGTVQYMKKFVVQ